MWDRVGLSYPEFIDWREHGSSFEDVAMYAAWLLDAPFSFTGHGADVFRDRSALVDKIRRASFIVCISNFHRAHYLEHGARPEQLVVAYCGIDSSHFKPLEPASRAGRPFRIAL